MSLLTGRERCNLGKDWSFTSTFRVIK